MLRPHEQRADFAAAGEVVDADEDVHVEPAVHYAGELSFGDDAKIEERRQLSDRRLHARAARERA